MSTYSRKRLLLILAFSVLLGACQSMTDLGPATQLVQIRSGEMLREFWFHDTLQDRKRRPLVIALHGIRQNGFEFLRTGGFLGHSVSAGYIVAAPNAINGVFSDGSPRGNESVDDVKFIEDIIAEVTKLRRGRIGPVYLVGFSSGAAMALRAAAESALPIAGVGAVADHYWVDTPPRPMPAIFMHGDRDKFNTTEGGYYFFSDGAIKTPPTDSAARQWARQFRCSTTVSASMEFVRHTGRYGCSDGASVVYMLVKDHGHYWPRVPSERDFLVEIRGPIQRNVDATRIIWDFFEKHVQ